VLSRGKGMGSLLICVQWYHFRCWTCFDGSEVRNASRYERETQLYGLFYRYVVCSCIPPPPALPSSLHRDASVRSLLTTADGDKIQALPLVCRTPVCLFSLISSRLGKTTSARPPHTMGVSALYWIRRAPRVIEASLRQLMVVQYCTAWQYTHTRRPLCTTQTRWQAVKDPRSCGPEQYIRVRVTLT
jgi:hypothetical protein